ncbi:ribitol 5-phosphate transferase FKRP-like [Oppia nitens]|uniref:ribitol 5-phosphate transferase FKRP-like n=1 Tax=Oppia nitens TaxID=1686743 RepID=UPI0023DA145F|nr:ribitol 5-phosphate transferase FKRP-like [Oppia nitens]
MNFNIKFIVKLLLFVCLIYWFIVLLANHLLSQLLLNSEDVDIDDDIWTQQMIQNEYKITFIINEFEWFENDLTATLDSLCGLSTINTILVISQRVIYPPIEWPINGHAVNNCDIKFIVNDFQFNKSLSESRVETYIESPYVMIVPDSVRIGSRHQVWSSIKYLNKLNSRQQRTALVLPISSDDFVDNRCLLINFDIKRWTLQYRQMDSMSSCDAFIGNNYAVLIKKTDLLELNQPFNRPFVESFFIQCKVRDIKVNLFSSNVVTKGRQLFLTNERNQWKHKMWSEERRKQLFALIGVKKLIDSQGVVQWFGCGKHTQRCFPTVINEMPDYLFSNRWTPVCCLDNLAQTGRHVFQVLESYSVRYWLEGGSLLGAARDGHIIPWDYDIDIGIYREDIVKCPFFPQSDPIVDSKGFVWEKASEGDFYRVHFSQSNRLHVDVFPFYSRNGTMTKNTWFDSHPQDCEFPEHYLLPLEKLSFIGFNASVPNNWRQFLEFKFGPNVIETPKYPKPDLLKPFL